MEIATPPASKRIYLPTDLQITSWQTVEKYFEDLKSRPINSVEDLKNWLHHRSELESVMQEDLGWRYIRMTCDTENKTYEEAFNFYVSEIEPNVSLYTQEINLKLLQCPFLDQLNDGRYYNFIRHVKKSVEIFREENIPIQAELHQKEQQYGSIAGAMTVEVEGKEITLQQAAKYLKSTDRSKREEVYSKIADRRLHDADKLDALYSELIQLRHKIAVNAGFANFRDYAFAAMGRFDYTPQDCFLFHESISKHVVPICNQLEEERKKQLGVSPYKPWDTEVDTDGKSPLKPFANGDEMMTKAIDCFKTINPFFGDCLQQLKSLEHVDLDSRIGKAPGGYNYPLYETGVPFIFMNSSGLLRDLVTIVHEGGHAIHSIVTQKLDYVDMKSCPSEVAELASMSMELISMEHWDQFFNNSDELKRARKEHLEDVLTVLPWVATVDKFQHWVYINPTHTVDERKVMWEKTFTEFGSNVIDWTGQENFKKHLWQKQLHIFEVPFYYIEYGMAQLGAIALWHNYKEDPDKAVQQYLNALKLGYTKSIGEIYNEAGAKFDFSSDYIKDLMQFVKQELAKL
ncbi:MAG: M3 family oligoendopeptidase [Bacteroidia bacterium]